MSPKLRQRFWSKVDKSGDCWEWTAYRDKKGYGRFYLSERKRNALAHRLSYVLTNGSIPDGLFVCHRCDNPPCVNPSHLFLGTAQDNADDMHSKGRWKPGIGEKNGFAKLTDVQALEILSRYLAGGVTQRQLATQFGVCKALISHLITGRRTIPTQSA